MNEQQHRKQNLRKQSTKNRIWCTLNPRPCTLNPKPWSLQLLHPEMASLDWLTSSMVVCYLILFQKPMESMHSFHEQQGSGERESLWEERKKGEGREGIDDHQNWWSLDTQIQCCQLVGGWPVPPLRDPVSSSCTPSPVFPPSPLSSPSPPSLHQFGLAIHDNFLLHPQPMLVPFFPISTHISNSQLVSATSSPTTTTNSLLLLLLLLLTVKILSPFWTHCKTRFLVYVTDPVLSCCDFDLKLLIFCCCNFDPRLFFFFLFAAM